jgi:hypothetical protein
MTDKPELIFMPGCFDEFEGTQEELDEFVKEIKEIFNSKSMEELDEISEPLDDIEEEYLEKRIDRKLN